MDEASGSLGESRGAAASWSLGGSVADTPSDMPRWVYVVGLVVLTSAGAAMRAAWLGHPMRYDESWTFLFYIAPRELAACLTYSAPNNHILHTLAVAASSWLGGNGPAVLRLPAYLAGVALIPAAGHLAVVWSGRRLAGLMAAVFVACSSMLVDYSVNARGYTLYCLAAVLLAERTARIVRDARAWRPWIGWVLIAAVGLVNVPVMIYPMVVLAAVVVLQALLGPAEAAVRWRAVRRTVGALMAAAVVGFILYIPVFWATGRAATEGNAAARSNPVLVCGVGLYAMISNPIIATRSAADLAAELPGVPRAVLAEWSRDTGWPWAAGVIVGLAAATVTGVRRRRAIALLPVVLAVALPGLALAQRVVPFARLWLFALPWVLGLACWGLSELAGWAPGGWARGVAAGAALLAVVAVNADSARRILRPDRRVLGECSLPDARVIVSDTLELADGRTGLAWDYELPTWPLLAYYEVLGSSPSRHFVPYLADDCRRVVVVVPGQESLAEVLEHRPRLAEAYGTMYSWRSYPTAEVFFAIRGEGSLTSSSPTR